MKSFQEFQAEMDKKYGSTSSKGSRSGNNAQRADFNTFQAQMDKKYGNDKFGPVVDSGYFKKFFSDADAFTQSAYNDFEQANRNNIAGIYANRKASYDDLSERSRNVRQYLEKNKERFDDESYSSVIGALDKFDQLASGMNWEFYKASKYGFDDYRDYEGLTTDELSEMQGGAADGAIAYTGPDGKNYTWSALKHDASLREDVAQKTSEYQKNSDWYEKSKNLFPFDNPYLTSDYWIAYEWGQTLMPYEWEYAQQDGKTRDEYEDWLAKKNYLENKYGVELGPYDSTEKLGDIMRQNYDGRQSDRFKYLDEMDFDEQRLLYYIFNTQGRDAAMDWYKQYEDIYQDRWNTLLKYAATELGRQLPGAGSVMSIFSSLGAPVEYALDMIDYIQDGEKPYNDLANFTSAVRGGAAENIDLNIGSFQVGDFLYNTGMSSIDSAAASSMFGKGGGVLLGMSAAAQATNDAYDRGLNDSQAIWTGAAAGAAEMIFEAMSIGNFKSLKEVASPEGKEILKNLLKTTAVNASEELLTETANIITDFVINDWISDDDFSEYSTAVRMYQNEGCTTEEAKNKALGDLGIRVAEAGVSGGLMGLGFGTAGQADAMRMGVRNYRSDTNTAHLLSMSEEGIQRLTDLATDAAKNQGGSYEKRMDKLIGKVRENASVRNTRKLYRSLSSAYTSQIKADAVKSLTRKGFSKSDADALGSALAAEATGGIIGAEESGILRKYQSDKRLWQTRQSLLENAKSSVGQRQQNLSGLRSDAYRSLIQSIFEQPNTINTDPTAAVEDSDSKASYEPSTDGQTIQKSTGEAVKIREIASIKNGKLTFRTEDGSEVAAFDVHYGTEAEAMVYEAVAQLEGIIDSRTATRLSNRLIHQIDEGDAISDQYIKAVAEAYRFGYEGRGIESTSAKTSIASELTDRQRNYAYKMGEKYAMESKTIRQGTATKASDNGTETAKDRKKTAKRSKAPDGKSYDNVQFESKVKQWGEKQRADVAFLDFVAREFAGGVTVHVFESFRGTDGKRYYYDSNGKLQKAPNGKYIQANGDIYLDLNAGDSGEGLVLNTFAHELYHHIEKWSPTKARQLAEFLVKEQGLDSVGAMVETQIEKAEAAGHGVKYFMKQGMSRTAAENTVKARAFSDFVADSLEAVFTKGDALGTLQRLKKSDQGLFDRIKAFVDKWVAKLKKYYQGDHTISIEGQAAAQLETFEQIQELFMEALVDAGENFRNADTVAAEKNTTDEDGVMYQMRSVNSKQVVWIENSGFTNAELSDPNVIAQYIAAHIGEVYRIIESGQRVYIGKDLPGEYTHSKYTSYLQARKKSLLKAKNKATAALGEMIEIAVNRRWEKTKHTASKDAKYGMYRYDTKFAFPTKDHKGNTIGVKSYDAELLIRNASDGKKYLYDIVNIRENTADAFDLRHKEARKGSYAAATQGDVSTDNVSQNSGNVNDQFSDRNVTPTSNREILLNATEDSTQTDWEKKLLQRYKDKAQEIADVEEKLNHTKQLLKELSPDVKYKSKVMALRSDKISMESQLRKLNSELRNMMDLKPLQDLLKREKQRVLRTGQQRYKNRLYEQRLSAEVKQSELLREHRETKAALRQQQSDYAIMEDEFIRIVKAYEKLEKAAEKSAAKAAQIPDLKQTLKDEAKKYREDSKTWDAEFRRLLREYEKSGRKINNLEQKIADQRKAAKDKVESRKRTEMRHQIRRDVKDIYKLYNRGKDTNNVKEEMKEFVVNALSSAELLLDDLYTDDDMIRNGLGIKLSPKENALLTKAKKILYRLDNPPTVSSVAELDEWNHQEERLKLELSKIKTQLREEFLRARRNQKGDILSMVMQDLCDAYKELANSTKPYIRNAFRPFVLMHLEGVRERLKVTRVEDMTLEELTELHEAYTMVLTSIRDANKAFCANRSVDYIAKQLISDFGGQKLSKSAIRNLARNISDAAGWNYEKLYYALERIGSPTFTQMFVNLANAENIIMEDVADAKAYQMKTVDKYGYNKWSINKKVDQEFVDNLGHSFQLTLGEIMLLYAYTRRGNVWKQLEIGGFVLERRGLTDARNATAYKLTPAQCLSITNTMTEEQKHFVEDMQKYLSDVMGEKGNEVSMKLYGVKLYNDPNYCPIHIAGEYKARAAEATMKKEAGFESLAHTGFTKTKNIDATATISLESFMDIWADHVNEMSRYHGAVLTLEDIRRVMNYSDHSNPDADSVAVKAMMENRFGKQAVQYFDDLYREVNSGAVIDKLQSLPKKALSISRKLAVAYSLSVLVQQPSSICRAFAMVDPKYFAGLSGAGASVWGAAKTVTNRWSKKQTAAYAEMVKYAPGVTLAKEIGGFDASGGGIRNYLMDTKKSLITSMKTGTAGEKLQAVGNVVDDNPIANLPNLADKIAWIEIWNACKREVKDKHRSMDGNSEAFMKLVGRRFTEVIRATQVYDSVFAKSPWLKSKNVAVQYLASFMNEPNVVANMAESAIRDIRKGGSENIRKGARKLFAVTRSIIFCNVLKSLIYAMRDDEEDETYIEKYMQALVSNVIGDFTGFNYFPFVRDIWSMIRGYDVERPDMSIFSDLISSIQKHSKVKNKDISEMSPEELEEWGRQCTEAEWGLVGAIAGCFGIPIKNIHREIHSVFSCVRICGEKAGKTTWNTFGDACYQGVVDALPWHDQESKSDKLYEALTEGDTKYLDRLQAGYLNSDGKLKTSYYTALRKGLRDHDPRIQVAVAARKRMDTEEYRSIIDEIVAEGHFDEKDIVAAIQSEYNQLKDADSEKLLFKAVASGDKKTSEELKSNFINDEGEFSESSYRSAIRKGLRENDPRILQAAEAKLDRDFATANKLLSQIAEEGHFSRSDISAAITAEYNQMKDD